jgi:hypothetical protein
MYQIERTRDGHTEVVRGYDYADLKMKDLSFPTYSKAEQFVEELKRRPLGTEYTYKIVAK